MLLRNFANSLMFLLLGGACLSMSPGNNEANPSAKVPTVQGVKPGVSDETKASAKPTDKQAGTEEIAQGRPAPRDGNFRMSDWDYRENWRYNRDAFYKGETQPEAYRDEHPYGAGGVGYDADVNYKRNFKRYRELHPQDATPQPYRGNYGEGSYNDAYRNNGYGNEQP